MSKNGDIKSKGHLSDLFHAGEQVEIEVYNVDDPEHPLVYPVWMRKPTVGQQDEARTSAAARQHRRKRAFKDKEGDVYVAMWDQNVATLETKDEVVEAIVSFEDARLRNQAYNEVLFGDKGSDWGQQGEKLLSALDAVNQRHQEIVRHNEALEEEDVDLKIQFDSDEELLKLQDDYAEFDEETSDYFEELMEAERASYRSQKTADLREELAKRIVSLEADMAWYQEYRMLMLYHAVRKIDARNEHYFVSKEDILELPQVVQTQLMDHLDRIDRGVDAKNLGSLLESLPS